MTSGKQLGNCIGLKIELYSCRGMHGNGTNDGTNDETPESREGIKAGVKADREEWEAEKKPTRK
jgi:hypothetical protein